MCSSLKLYQCQAYLIRLTWIVYDWEGRGHVTKDILGVADSNCSKHLIELLRSIPFSFFSVYFIKVQVVSPNKSTDADTARRNPVLFHQRIWFLYGRQLFICKASIRYGHVDITFSRWDIVLEVYELVD